MNKLTYRATTIVMFVIFISVTFMSPLTTKNSSAQLFGGGSDENVNAELRKLNARLAEKLIPDVGDLKNAQSDLVEQMNRLNESSLKRHNQLVRQVELLNSSLASLQGSIEQIQVTNHKADAKLHDDINQVKSQMGYGHKSQQETNQKLIDILSETLVKQQNALTQIEKMNERLSVF